MLNGKNEETEINNMGHADYHLEVRPMPGFDIGGDTGFICEHGGRVFAVLVDIAGHGKKAYDLAVVAREFVEKNCHGDDLTEIIKKLHKLLSRTRGGVAGLCLLNMDTGVLKCSGIGNINIRVFGRTNRHVMLKDGLIGYMMTSPRTETLTLEDGEILIMYSDGVRSHFGPEDMPDIFRHDAKTIAKDIIRMFGKKIDDASCIVLRYRKGEGSPK